MFQFLRGRARSGKGRPNSIRPALDEFERRDVPAAHANPSSLVHGPAAAFATDGNTNGAAGEIPAFFNGNSVTINVKELPDKASESTLANNPSVQIIYVTNDLDEKQDFAPVINAVPGRGFNALWEQVRISFNTGFAPRQFTSEADILAAAKAGEITLTSTGEVYRDSVVGAGQNG